MKLVKTAPLLKIILNKVIFFNEYIEKDKKINKEKLNKIIVNISVVANINKDLMFFLQHQQKLIESFNENYHKAVLYYLRKNNNIMIKILEEDIKQERNIIK